MRVSHLIGATLAVMVGIGVSVHSLSAQGQVGTAASEGGGSPPDVETPIYHRDSRIRRESVSILTIEGTRLSIGQRVDDMLKASSNVVVQTDLLGVPFGPINGYADDNMKIGWNNRDRIIYIEALSHDVATSDGLRIGATKIDVQSVLGIPFMERDSSFRYQNSENEVVGILFLFDSYGTVSKIILFAYV